MIIDSHCHIYDEKLKDYKEEILKNLEKNDQIIVCCADNLENSNKCVELALKNKNIFAGVGIHPECCESFDENTIKDLEKLVLDNNKDYENSKNYENNSKNYGNNNKKCVINEKNCGNNNQGCEKNNNQDCKIKKIVAIGEIGLDYHYDYKIKEKFDLNTEKCIEIREKIEKSIEINENIEKNVKNNEDIDDLEYKINKKKEKDLKNNIRIQEEIEKNHNLQKKILKKQIFLAKKLNLPCIFHIREATGDFLEILRELKAEFDAENTDLARKFTINGVVHSFSGSVETAKIYALYGLKVGFNGIITFKNAKNTVEVASKIPLDNILIETDSPYLTPEPFRGKINRPEYVYYVAKKLAEIKNIPVEEVIKQTSENAIKLFDLKIK